MMIAAPARHAAPVSRLRDGFALLSVMVAVVLLATGVMAIGAANTARIRAQTFSNARTESLAIARSAMENLRARDPWTIDSDSARVGTNGLPSATGPYMRVTNVTVLNTNLLLVTILVRPPRNMPPVTLTTKVYRASAITGT